jgi:hypothetical protein
METRSDLEGEGTHSVADGQCAPYGARRSVERGEEAVSGGIDLLAAEALQLAPYDGLVGGEELRPTAVSQIRRKLRRPDDVNSTVASIRSASGARATPFTKRPISFRKTSAFPRNAK